MHRFNFNLLLSVLMSTTTYGIKFHDHVIMRNEDTFYIGKKEYSMAQVGDYLRKGQCTSLNYTHMVKPRDGCISMPVDNKSCGGLCTSKLHPKDIKNNKCVACGPNQIEEKTITTLCKRKHKQQDEGNFYQHKFNVHVVKGCGCTEYDCIHDIKKN